MNRDQLKRGNELIKKIDICEKVLNQMQNNDYMGGTYRLTVSEYSDGSGWNLDMCGIDVLSIKDVIKEEVRNQLLRYQMEFEEL
jgi:hypothetical protein